MMLFGEPIASRRCQTDFSCFEIDLYMAKILSLILSFIGLAVYKYVSLLTLESFPKNCTAVSLTHFQCVNFTNNIA